jgi:hypothetical protein
MLPATKTKIENDNIVEIEKDVKRPKINLLIWPNYCKIIGRFGSEVSDDIVSLYCPL